MDLYLTNSFYKEESGAAYRSCRACIVWIFEIY